MGILNLKFDTIDHPIQIDLTPGINADFFAQQIRSFARPADRIFFLEPPETKIKKFCEQANLAKKIFGFSWKLDCFDQDNFNNWHRDIESFNTNQHLPWTKEKENLFVDLHALLHLAEPNKENAPYMGRQFLQIRWFEKSVPWPQHPNFVSRLDIKQGDVVMDFPHVGKSPWMCFVHNDNKDLPQCCRLPDACAPSFFIHLDQKRSMSTVQKTQLIEKQRVQLIDWYKQNQSQLENMFTVDQMISYDGEYVIGRLKNLQDVEILSCADFSSVSLV